MQVAPHPHTGLQTVSWLFSGEIEHRDSAGHHAAGPPRRGQPDDRRPRHQPLGGVDAPTTRLLHGAQLWVALPEGAATHRPRLRALRAAADRRATAGAAGCSSGPCSGDTSPVDDVHAAARGRDRPRARRAGPARGRPGVRARRARRLAVDVTVEDRRGQAVRPRLRPHPARRRSSLTRATTSRSRVLLLGGHPFGEPIVMWWNFVGRSHDEIVGSARSGRPRSPATARSVPRQPRRRRPAGSASSRRPPPPDPRAELPNARLKERR